MPSKHCFVNSFSGWWLCVLSRVFLKAGKYIFISVSFLLLQPPLPTTIIHFYFAYGLPSHCSCTIAFSRSPGSMQTNSGGGNMIWIGNVIVGNILVVVVRFKYIFLSSLNFKQQLHIKLKLNHSTIRREFNLITEMLGNYCISVNKTC